MAKGFNSLLERFLVFITVTSFMLAIMVMAGPIFNKIEMGKILINWVSLVIVGISGLIFILIQQIFAREKIKVYLHAVVIFFYEIFSLLICWFTRQYDIPVILIPFIIIQYLLQNALNNMFVYHDIFINECGELSGKELEAHLFHNNLSAIDFGAKARLAGYILTILPLVLFLIVFSVLKSGNTVSFTAIIFILIFMLGVFFHFFIMGIYRNDIFFGFLGFRNFITDKRRLFRSVLVILTAACIFGAVLSSNKAFLKITVGMEAAPVVTESPSQFSTGEITDMRNPFADLEVLFPERKTLIPDWVWALIAKILQWGAIAGLSIGVIIFLLKPFFSAHWKQFWKEGRLLKFLRHILSEIRQFFRFVFTRSAPDLPYATVQSRKFSEGIKDYLKKAGRSKEKNAEIDRLTKHFMKLIDWGEAKGIEYSQTLAPAEYTALFNKAEVAGDAGQAKLAEQAKLTEQAALAGMLFEKALYDKNILTADEEKAFVDAIKEIICG